MVNEIRKIIVKGDFCHYRAKRVMPVKIETQNEERSSHKDDLFPDFARITNLFK